MNRHCPALLVAALASSQGKTTVTAALARLHRRAGQRLRAFKCEPDFLDPQILTVASGAPVQNLDLWMCGQEGGAARLYPVAEFYPRPMLEQTNWHQAQPLASLVDKDHWPEAP